MDLIQNTLTTITIGIAIFYLLRNAYESVVKKETSCSNCAVFKIHNMKNEKESKTSNIN